MITSSISLCCAYACFMCMRACVRLCVCFVRLSVSFLFTHNTRIMVREYVLVYMGQARYMCQWVNWKKRRRNARTYLPKFLRFDAIMLRLFIFTHLSTLAHSVICDFVHLLACRIIKMKTVFILSLDPRRNAFNQFLLYSNQWCCFVGLYLWIFMVRVSIYISTGVCVCNLKHILHSLWQVSWTDSKLLIMR